MIATIFAPILPIRKLRLREVQLFAQDHTAHSHYTSHSRAEPRVESNKTKHILQSAAPPSYRAEKQLLIYHPLPKAVRAESLNGSDQNILLLICPGSCPTWCSSPSHSVSYLFPCVYHSLKALALKPDYLTSNPASPLTSYFIAQRFSFLIGSTEIIIVRPFRVVERIKCDDACSALSPISDTQYRLHNCPWCDYVHKSKNRPIAAVLWTQPATPQLLDYFLKCCEEDPRHVGLGSMNDSYFWQEVPGHCTCPPHLPLVLLEDGECVTFTHVDCALGSILHKCMGQLLVTLAPGLLWISLAVLT